MDCSLSSSRSMVLTLYVFETKLKFHQFNVGILLAVQFMETESLNFSSNGGYTKHKITIKFFSFLHETFRVDKVALCLCLPVQR